MVGGEGNGADIGFRIREARLERGWTHEELARRMGVNWRTVQRWQKGRLPRIDTLRRLAGVLDVPQSSFLDDDGAVTLSELRERLAELSVRVERLAETVASLADAEQARNPSNEGG